MRGLVVSFLVLAVCSAGLADQISVETKRNGVAIKGAGDSVAWIGVANEPARGRTRTLIRYGFAQPNATSAPAIALPDGVAPRSLWVAVDMATGQFASTTSRFLKLKNKLASEVAELVSGGKLAVRVKAQWLEALLVRPAVGAWYFSSVDGGPRDGDGLLDGFLTVTLSSAVPLANSPSVPAALRPNDVLIVIDVKEMTMYAVRH